MAMDKPMLDDVGLWVQAFLSPTVLVELAALAGCVALAWALVALLQRGLQRGDPRSILFGVRIVDGALFPLLLLGLAYVARDHGPGVPDDQLAQLAQAFHRPDSARTRSAGGVGLGLYLCRLVAQAHGGTLSLSNARPGLRVTVSLPQANPPLGPQAR